MKIAFGTFDPFIGDIGSITSIEYGSSVVAGSALKGFGQEPIATVRWREPSWNLDAPEREYTAVGYGAVASLTLAVLAYGAQRHDP